MSSERRTVSAGHAVFAATLVAIGILGLMKGDLVAIWQLASKAVPARTGLAYLCAVVSVATGAGLLWQRAAGSAARVLLGYLLIWLLLFKAPVIFRAPGMVVSWEDCAETCVIVSASWVLYAGLAMGWDRQRFGFATGERGLRIARTLYGLALIPFGLAHFAYLKETAALVPAWLPCHLAWAYLTGCTYLAAGVAVTRGLHARLAAALAAVQMGMFTLLVWGPILAAGPKDAFQLNECVISLILMASGWVVADSYGGVPWLRRWARS
jgi:uncharacterized membrane protein